MFSNYEIKRVRGVLVLYLYLDLRMEVAFLNKHKKKTTLQQEVKKYINNNHISFKGKLVLVMAGGMLVATLMLANNKEPVNYTLDNYTTNVLTVDNSLLDNTEVLEESSNINITNDNALKNENNDSKNEVIKEENKVNNNKNEVNSSDNKSEVNNTTSDTEENQSKTMIKVYRSNGSILNIELEEYLIGVVASEMPASFSMEALKAQSVAARTYALKAIENGVRLTDTTSTQVYKDNTQLKAMWGGSYNTYYTKVKKAIDSTKGLVMYYNGSLINAYYHSTSNGKTEDASYVFGEYPYLKSVDSSVDLNVSSYLRTVAFTYEEISAKLGIIVTNASTIHVSRNTSNRVDTIIIDTSTYDGVTFRTLLGLRSTDFDIVLNEENVSITTRGYGHGVGMSQYGANEYARLGYSYIDILKTYYTGITIDKY